MAENTILDDLLRIITREMDDYARGMRERPSSEVYDLAEEIAATRFCYNQIARNLHVLSIEDLEYLLRFEHPLVVVRDKWMSDQDNGFGEVEAFDHVLWELRDKGDAEQEYALDQCWKLRQEGPGLG